MTHEQRTRIGIIGLGAMGARHIQWFLEHPEAEIVALVDPNQELAKKRLTELCEPRGQHPHLFASHHEALAAGEMQAAVIVTPHAMHYEQVLASLERGLHVFCEKPLAISARQAAEIRDKAAETRRVLFVGFPGPVSKQHRYIKELQTAGRLSRLAFVDGRVAQRWWPLAARNWRGDPKLSGGGQLMDSGSHLLNSIIHLAGSRVAEVFAWIEKRHMSVDVDSIITLRLENGTKASAVVSGDTNHFEHNITLLSDKCWISVGIYGMYLVHRQGRELIREMPMEDSPDMAEAFLRALREGVPPGCDAEQAVHLAEVFEAAYSSSESNSPVAV